MFAGVPWACPVSQQPSAGTHGDSTTCSAGLLVLKNSDRAYYVHRALDGPAWVSPLPGQGDMSLRSCDLPAALGVVGVPSSVLSPSQSTANTQAEALGSGL